LISFVKDRSGHDRRYAIDSGKLMASLGWAPQYDFEDGIVRTVRWYLEHPEWVAHVRSAEYRQYLQRQYGG
jgi:dTDP-glucose 4,6-dehydratase